MYTNRPSQNRPFRLPPSAEKHSSLQKNTLNRASPPQQHVRIENPRNSTYSTKFHFLVSPVHQTHFHLPNPHFSPQVLAMTPFALFPRRRHPQMRPRWRLTRSVSASRSAQGPKNRLSVNTATAKRTSYVHKLPLPRKCP